ncbi:hypothetical protein [Candidatus Nitrospira inopinata]|uniref:Uncharacterized protein n=1 Tax=Candidatus Nitrospira inopinata TaxID=1715989 RepID=A0A0S4L000_9BACT|nr:hypothetical protein [Candidatus Nitrospira inopinata]CUQ67924.1 exported protein of unknown function [Candidatus Nitrospira inopinata]
MRQVMRGLPFIVLLLVFAMPSLAATGPEPGIAKGDHQALAMYYADQAQDFKAKVRFWDNTAESYEHHPELYKSSDIADEAAHCRQIARNYRKMADEAAALASEHLSLTRKGP